MQKYKNIHQQRWDGSDEQMFFGVCYIQEKKYLLFTSTTIHIFFFTIFKATVRSSHICESWKESI